MILTATPYLWEQMLSMPLEQRLAPAPKELLDYVVQYNAATGNPAQPAASAAHGELEADLQAAIAELPPVIKAKLEPLLLGVFFMTGLGSSAVTDVVAYADGGLVGVAVAIDVEVFLSYRANGFATWRENTPFLPVPGLSLEVRIAREGEDDRKEALQYILLHEFGHVLTAGQNLMPDWWEDPAGFQDASHYSFLPLSWEFGANGHIAPRGVEDFPLREDVFFYQDPLLSGEDIPAIYQALEKTGFPTLYGATSVYEDFAECFATYVHSVLLGKPYELRICRDGQSILESGDFWKSPRSQAKAALMEDFLARESTPFVRRLSRSTLDILERATETFLGLAPFLRLSIAGADLREPAMALLEMAGRDQDNAILWMNLSTAFFAISERNLGLSMQEQALLLQRSYRIPAAQQPARYRLLVLTVAGDLAGNTPIDCLLEGGGVDLLYYYATEDAPLPSHIPDHDGLLVAIADSEANRPLLSALALLLANWERPVINFPTYIPNTERNNVSLLLQGVPGLVMPPTRPVSRAFLESVGRGESPVEAAFEGCSFPIILRPVGSQAGRDLAKIEGTEDIAGYLAGVADANFYISRYIDYRSEDGLFRKYRVALIGGQPHPSHMAISSHWMIHYVNAGMYEDAAKREEEGVFMERFGEFARRHREALAGIHERIGLDYLCIDCAQTRDGQLLIFEADHIMVVHAMDSETLFPFKQVHMGKVRKAFEDFLVGLSVPAALTP
ncbi:MAG TPA: hypothetical protein VFF03_11435 [Rhodocyclaceae bacterium]|nr:hypothetical protein [Rhodocyclaceae bacterium]